MKLFNKRTQPQRQEYQIYTISLSEGLYNKIENLRKKYNFDNREDFLQALINEVEK